MDALFYMMRPSDVVTALVMMGVLRLMETEEDRLSFRKLMGLILTVMLVMLIVRGGLRSMGAPHWTRYAAYLVVWFVVLTQFGKVRALSASVVVGVLLAVHVIAYAMEERFTRIRMPDGELVSPSEAKKRRAQQPEAPSRFGPPPAPRQ